MDRRSLVASPAQFYETTIYNRDGGPPFSFVVVPARSMVEREVPPVDDVLRRLGLREFRLRRSSGEVPPWALPFAIDIALGRDEEDFLRWGSFFPEVYLSGPRSRSRAERAGPSAFAQYLAYAPVVPFESSPLAPKPLSDLATTAGGSMGGALGAYMVGDPLLLLLTVPAGIVICGAARGVSQALEIGLRARILGLMGVEDPDVREYGGSDEPDSGSGEASSSDDPEGSSGD